MKKLMLLAAAAATLAACTSEEEVYTGQPQEIGFEAVSGKATRAVVDGNYLTTDGKAKDDNNAYLPMWLTAIYHTGSSHTAYFTNVKYVRAAGDKLWHGETKPYYYPANGTTDDHMDFMAYSLSNNATATATWASDVDWKTFSTDPSSKTLLTLSSFAPALAGQTDVMYSELDENSMERPCPPATDDEPTLKFKHAMAWLYFNVTCKTENVIKVKSLKMNGVSLDGTVEIKYNYKTVESTPTYFTSVNWPSTSLSPAVGQSIFTDATGKDPYTTDNVKGGLLVPVQNRSGFTMEYTIETGGSPIVLTYNYNPATIDDPSNPGHKYSERLWEAGKKYIYNIEINANEILVNAGVSNYEDESYNIEVASTTSVTTPSSAPARK